jgi:hypothetical protein
LLVGTTQRANCEDEAILWANKINHKSLARFGVTRSRAMFLIAVKYHSILDTIDILSEDVQNLHFEYHTMLRFKEKAMILKYRLPFSNIASMSQCYFS